MRLQELATNIFSTSIIPYSAFLYWLTKSKKTPPLALFGFYFLLVFVFATIPAGVIGERNMICKHMFNYAVLMMYELQRWPMNADAGAALKVYHKSLANVDFLHGSAESMLTVTNLLIGRWLFAHRLVHKMLLSICTYFAVRHIGHVCAAVLGLRQGIKQAEAARSKQDADNRDETRIPKPADAAKQ